MSDEFSCSLYESPFGALELQSNGDALVQILLPVQLSEQPSQDIGSTDMILLQAAKELDEYFSGRRTDFSVPLDPLRGTTFQRQVWQTLRRISFGTTISYAELAKDVGNPTAVRAVGAANGRNPLPIMVPCHRVIGSDGSLTGYAGGLQFKEELLHHEGALTSLFSG